MSKKMIVALAFAAFMPMISQAKDNNLTLAKNDYSDNIDTKKIRFGVYVAPAIDWMRPTTVKSNNNEFTSKNAGSKVGFTYGLMMDYNFADNYSFVTGLQVNMAGGKIQTERATGATTTVSSVNSADFDYNLTYLEVPVAIKLRTDPISNFRFFGQVGLTTGFNIAKKANYSVSYIDSLGDSKTVDAEKVKLKGIIATSPVLFAMSIGAGLEYPLNNKLAAYFGVFFNNGFAPDATNPNNYKLETYQGSFKDGNTRLNNFSFRLGLFF